MCVSSCSTQREINPSLISVVSFRKHFSVSLFCWGSSGYDDMILSVLLDLGHVEQDPCACLVVVGFPTVAQNHGCLCLCEYCCILLISSQSVFTLGSHSVLLSIITLNPCPTYILKSSFSSGIVVVCPSKSKHIIFLPA